jgi:hypothetical protein
MTMTGNQNINKDVVGPLVDDSLPPNVTGPFQQITQAIANLFLPHHKELLTQLRVPTPMKVSKLLTISAAGTIGGSVALPTLDQIIYTAPMSSEAWLHRITITSPENGPANPIGGGAYINTTLNPANPGAGNQIPATAISPHGTIVSVQFTLTTSATVANRVAAITINGVTYSAAVAQTASLVETYTFFPGAVATTVLPGTGGQLSVPIPPGIIVTTGTISSAITGLQAGDTITAISIVVSSQGSLSPELVLIGSTSGETILSLPEIQSNYQVAPTQFTEGRLSAPHLDRGESICVAGDGLPANNHLRFDLQLLVVTGLSEWTPKDMSPSDLTLKGAVGIG